MTAPTTTRAQGDKMKPYYDEDGITIYCGDCREVLPHLAASSVDLVLTDPPYGAKERTERESNGRGYRLNPRNAGKSYDFPAIEGDDEPFDPSHLLHFHRLILWGANYYADKLPPSRCWFVWDKREGSTPDDNADCEMAWTNLDMPARLYSHLWRGMLKASERDQRRLHPSQKPVALMRWCLQRAGLKPGALVLDPYMGSGPIARAAADLGLRYIGIELEERYCSIAVDRLSQNVLALEAL